MQLRQLAFFQSRFLDFKKSLADLLSYRLCLIPVEKDFRLSGRASSSGEHLQAVMKWQYRYST